MGARLRRSARGAVLVLMTFGALLAVPGAAPSPRPELAAVATLVGGNILAKIACVGCAAGLFGLGGATIGGVAILAMLYPEAFGACAVMCIGAF